MFKSVEIVPGGGSGSGIMTTLNVLLHRNITSALLQRVATRVTIPLLNSLGRFIDRLAPNDTRSTCGIRQAHPAQQGRVVAGAGCEEVARWVRLDCHRSRSANSFSPQSSADNSHRCFRTGSIEPLSPHFHARLGQFALAQSLLFPRRGQAFRCVALSLLKRCAERPLGAMTIRIRRRGNLAGWSVDCAQVMGAA